MRSTQNGVTNTLLEELAALRLENDQLRTALETRIILEQAKGAISARCGVNPETAFEMMRSRARSQRRNIHEYAADIVANGGRLDAEAEDREVASRRPGPSRSLDHEAGQTEMEIAAATYPA